MKIHLTRFLSGMMALMAIAGVANGQIFVSTNSSTVREYNLNGTLADGSYVTGLSGPLGMAVSGTDLFIANNANNTISESTTTGGGNSTLVPSSSGALAAPTGIAVSGSTLFVTNNSGGSVSTFTTAGETLHSQLIYFGPGSSPSGIAVMGNYLFVAHTTGIDEYLLDGTLVHASIQSYGSPAGLAVSGTTLYVAEETDGGVSSYTFDSAGNLLSSNTSLITGLNFPYAIAATNTDLYVGDYNDGTIGEYTLDGSIVNASLISGLSANSGLGLAVESAIPEPSAYATFLGLGALGLAAYRRRQRQLG